SGFNVYEALENCSEHLIQFGGHKYAAGLTIQTEQIEAFRKKFDQIVATHLSDEMKIAEQVIDLSLSLNQIFSPGESYYSIPKVKRILDQFEPYGPGNMKPVLMTTDVFMDPAYTRIVGDNHLKTRRSEEHTSELQSRENL